MAEAARLTPAWVSETNVVGATFSGLRREMKQALCGPGTPGVARWMHGARNDVSIIVRPLALYPPGSPGGKVHTHTTAIAEIDPPLFAGLRLFSRDLISFYGYAHGATPSGHPSIDASFITVAFDEGRVRELFLPHGLPDRLGEAVLQASRACSIVVKDSSVEAIAVGPHARLPVVDVDTLVDIASSIAKELSSRSLRLTHTPLEVTARSAWERLAVRLGLSVDPLRWHIFGRLGDVEVSAMLDGSPPAVSTTFRARFRQRLPCPMFLRRGYRTKAVVGYWSDGAAPGYPELDSLLVLASPHREQARSLLESPRLRELLAAEARTSNLVLDDCEIVLGRGGFAATREIAERFEALVAIVDLMTPPLPTAGPFR